MHNLYKKLAPVYEAMYATFIDYDEEYALYHDILDRYHKKHVLELGCGTGYLSGYFIRNGYDYIGLDISPEMLHFARQRNPGASYFEGDMRSFKLNQLFDSTIMTDRTISYVLREEDIESMFLSIHHNLEKGGILSFDFIDADTIIPEIGHGVYINHEAQHRGISYLRKSKWPPNLTNGFGFDWTSIYYRKEEKELIHLGDDRTTIRTFSRDEIAKFLRDSGFELKEMTSKSSYAFPTYVAVAEKTIH